ncbi:hypothetical protein BCR33DRAFT_718568 [Rhizoclosmatium globosum]|uniref:Uncharacterized protein n=1 Tax=Rhizoclosmatium globosum TaxID=329046 RepID=A0A1Y2C4H3_9FUNG|nr:hypothetical protein BCR33DRAFT_718568 [Rhizoclosmatium globosum]|eukprot:ORY41911.1 hypothetical protein BCR33DRAFT_718568 [Rhizoclosmatium globosum]
MTLPHDGIDLDVSIYGYVALLSFSLLQMIFFVVLMLRSSNQNEKRVEKDTFFSPINKALIGIFASFIIQNISEILRRIPRNVASFRIGSVTSYIGLSGAEYGALMYSWIRSKGIIELIMPNQFNRIRVFVAIAPVLLFAEVFSSTANQILIDDPSITKPVSFVHFICTILAGLTVITSDTLFIYIFIKYLRETQAETHVVDAKFTIIAKYGIWAIVFEYCAFVLFVIALFTPEIVSAGFIMVAGGFCMNCVGIALVYIKIKIQRLPAGSVRGTSGIRSETASEVSKSQLHTFTRSLSIHKKSNS